MLFMQNEEQMMSYIQISVVQLHRQDMYGHTFTHD
jgi:hypothetical protein